MRRVAAGVVLAALLMLLASVVTRTSEKSGRSTPDRETPTVLMVTVECPCGGECDAHARVVADYSDEAEVGAVLKLPIRNVVSPRGYIERHSRTDSGLRTGYVLNTDLRAGRVLKLPHDGRFLNVIHEDTTNGHEASAMARSPNVGVM
jgi:hypothetical protein